MASKMRRAEESVNRLLPMAGVASRVIGAISGFLALWYWIPTDWAWPLRILACAAVVVVVALVSRVLLLPVVLAIGAAKTVK